MLSVPMIILLGLSYAIGAIPAGYLIVRLLRGTDVRGEGSGNIGATNVLRTTGKAAGIATLAFDVGKGMLAVALAHWLPGLHDPAAPAMAMLAVVTGHVFPITLGFRGGKGVASAAGAAVIVSPLAAFAALGALVAAVLATRWVSLGSLLFAALFPVLAWWRGAGPVAAAALSLTALLIAFRHGANIRRLLAGTEHRLGAAR